MENKKEDSKYALCGTFLFIIVLALLNRHTSLNVLSWYWTLPLAFLTWFIGSIIATIPFSRLGLLLVITLFLLPQNYLLIAHYDKLKMLISVFSFVFTFTIFAHIIAYFSGEAFKGKDRFSLSLLELKVLNRQATLIEKLLVSILGVFKNLSWSFIFGFWVSYFAWLFFG